MLGEIKAIKILKIIISVRQVHNKVHFLSIWRIHHGWIRQENFWKLILADCLSELRKSMIKWNFSSCQIPFYRQYLLKLPSHRLSKAVFTVTARFLKYRHTDVIFLKYRNTDTKKRQIPNTVNLGRPPLFLMFP